MSLSGVLTGVGVIGFSKSSEAISVTGGNRFSIPFGTDNLQYMFCFPKEMTLKSISVIFNNWLDIYIVSMSTHITPFIALATAAPGTYNFTIIESSKVFPAKGYVNETGVLGQNHPTSTIFTAIKNNMDVTIPAGVPVAIVGGVMSIGTVHQLFQQYIYMHGSMIFE